MLESFERYRAKTADAIDKLKDYSARYAKEVAEEGELDPEARLVAKVGKLDAKKNIERTVQSLLSQSTLQCMGTMLDTVVF
jgi:26S proteasome regulatory subunit N11